jgi:trans-aconitate 2-methyltransferase
MPACTWDAADYAESSAGQQQWARELIAKLGLRGTERLLDVGCGDGKVTAEIAADLPGGSVLGVDNSPSMIDLAGRRFPPETHPNLRFQLEDAGRLPFRDEFDVVFSNATLHWLVDHHPVLRGIRRSLRPGGKALLQMGGRGNAADVLEVVDRIRATDEWRRHFEGFTFPYGFHGPDDYRRWMAEAGLVALRVELIPKDLRHADRAAFEGWFRTTWLPYTQRIPEERRQAFVSQVVDAYLEAHAPTAEAGRPGPVTLGMVRLEVEALRPQA